MQFRLQLCADCVTVPQSALASPLQVTDDVRVAAEQTEGEACKTKIQRMLVANNPFSGSNFDRTSLMAVLPPRLLILLSSSLKDDGRINPVMRDSLADH
jgi:hypothetical protein